MKQYLSVFLLGMILSAVAVQAADLSVSESTIEYGTVKEGPPVIKTVVLSNSGTQPLTISSAMAS